MKYFIKTKAIVMALITPYLWRIMKLALALTLLTVTQLYSKGYSQQISIHVEHAPIQHVFSLIEQQSGYVFFYENELIEGQHLTMNISNSSLDNILKNQFKDLPFEFSIVKGNNIVVKRKPSKANRLTKLLDAALQENIKGRVMNEQGEPLPGVSIRIKESNIGTVADADGNFVLTATIGNTLLFTYMNYFPEEVNITSAESLQITLRENIQDLGEVVVTALGISREKKSLSYAVSELSGENFDKARENNLGNALTGKIAGVNATSSPNGPSGSTRVLIRGNGSLSGNNQPLYVINGIPMSSANQGTPSTYGGRDMGDGLTSINPDDIESISVLKGGTAAALYGSRAANGVILITTKSGKAMQGIGVEYYATYTRETPINMLDWQYQYGSGSRGLAPTSQAEAIAYGRTSWGALLDGSEVVQPDGVVRPYSAQQNNIGNFYDVGSNFSNTVALTGGDDKLNFRFSAADLNNKGIIPNAQFKRQSFNLSTNANLSEKVLFESHVQYNIEKTNNRPFVADFTNNPNSSVGLLATNIDIRTLSPGYDETGYEMAWNDYIYVTNPYFAVNKIRNNDERRRFIGSSSLRYNITKAWYARGRIGIDYSNLDTYNLTPTGTLYNVTGQMQSGRGNLFETNAELILGYDKIINDFSINAFVGGNKMYSQHKARDLSSGNFKVPFQYFISNGSSQTFTDSFSEFGINSLFAAADIGFKGYLYLNMTGRQDWFSTLSPNSNSLFYPSIGASFIPTELFKDTPSWLSYAKLRGAWAQVGGGAPDPYGLSLTYATGSITHLGQTLMSINGSTIPNALKPYTSTNTELGIELRLLDSRLGLDFTWYNRKTTDDIVRASIPYSTGYQDVLLNIGEMSNKGVELLLTGQPLSPSSQLKWNVSFNMAYNINKVVKVSDDLNSLAGLQPRTLNAYVYHYEGEPYGMIAGNRRMRDQEGNIVYNNANGIPLQSTLTPLGRGVPPLTLGLTNSFSYKNFSFEALLDGKFGAVVYSSTNAYGTYYGLHQNTVENGVRESGIQVSGVDQNGAPYNATIAAQDYYQGTALTITEDNISKADFIKLRQLTFGYTFPQKFMAKTPIQSIRLSFVARNLLMLYNTADNIDPESSYSVSGDAQGLENFGLPPTRNFGFNLAVKF